MKLSTTPALKKFSPKVAIRRSCRCDGCMWVKGCVKKMNLVSRMVETPLVS